MPVSSSARGSTADATNGVQVAQSTNEVGAGPILQTVVVEGNKTTYSEGSRTGLTTVDSATDLSSSGFGTSLIDLGNAARITLRATCSTGTSAPTLQGRLVHYDASGNVISVGELITFLADATRRITAAGDYVCPRWITDAGQARKVKFYVESISSGTWAVYVRPI